MSDKLYYTIGEVSKMLDEAPSTLRFWETEFAQLRPSKTSRGTRSYTARDIELLRRVQYLLRQRGYTLEGAREQLKTHPTDDPIAQVTANLVELRQFLVDLKETL